MNEQPSRVAVIDVNMPFLSMVRFMVKWAIASIPALVILIVVAAFVTTLTISMIGPRTPTRTSGPNPYLERIPGR